MKLKTRCVIPLALLSFFLGSCASSPEPGDTSFTRASRLVTTIERAVDEGRWIDVVNHVSYGYEAGLLSRIERQKFLELYLDMLTRDYQTAIADEEYSIALQAEWNLRILHSLTEYHGVDVPVAELKSRDQLLLDSSKRQIEQGEMVLGLYTVLRRSQVADLDAEMLQEYIRIARELNHDEALRRFSAIAERRGTAVPPPEQPLETPGDEPAMMLPGTVTIWVNKGIRIESGLGFPDRVIGSGFFVDPRGYLITNYHVISSEVDPTYEGYSRLFIKLPGRPDQRIPARVIGYDRIFDLALLKVEIDPSYVFSLSDTRVLSPGERVLALGSPGGLDSTITSGIVSAAGRRFLQMGEAIQVDVPINPGNSGGPLVLPSGQVAGIVFAGLEQFEGVNFAIPSYWIRHFFPRLYQDGEVVHPWIGVNVREGNAGLQVVYVTPGSPAEKAGISTGETLTHINGRALQRIAEAQDIILAVEPGYTLHTVWATSREGEAPATVERLLAADERPYSPIELALESQPIEELFPVLFGMEVTSVASAPWGPDFVITNVFPGSVADESSLSVNDPFALRDWRVDKDLRAAFIQIIIKKKKAGFIESGVQLGAYLETDSFL